ncbi:DUF7178 family protein [Streptomyces sp. S1]|uniref:DUF7178 family protein n=1 Tax=Streptomyces sp. S1 TaxID=718288 RepID=UPI003D738480
MIPVNPSDSTRRRYVRNIVATYHQATEDQERRGKSWYRTAHQLADMMSGGNVTAGAGVIAALSVNKAWDMNRRLAADAFEGNLHGTFSDALGKAAKILAGVDPAEVLPMGIKTGNFYRCILDPDDAEAVCIDRHAHDIALGTPQGSKDRGLSSRARYAALSLAYRNAAAILGVLPSQVQAVTWVVWTESLAGVKHRPRLERYGHE